MLQTYLVALSIRFFERWSVAWFIRVGRYVDLLDFYVVDDLFFLISAEYLGLQLSQVIFLDHKFVYLRANSPITRPRLPRVILKIHGYNIIDPARAISTCGSHHRLPTTRLLARIFSGVWWRERNFSIDLSNYSYNNWVEGNFNLSKKIFWLADLKMGSIIFSSILSLPSWSFIFIYLLLFLASYRVISGEDALRLWSSLTIDYLRVEALYQN